MLFFFRLFPSFNQSIAPNCRIDWRKYIASNNNNRNPLDILCVFDSANLFQSSEEKKTHFCFIFPRCLLLIHTQTDPKCSGHRGNWKYGNKTMKHPDRVTKQTKTIHQTYSIRHIWYCFFFRRPSCTALWFSFPIGRLSRWISFNLIRSIYFGAPCPRFS